MRVVTKKKIVEYYLKHSTSKTALELWYKTTSKAEWDNLNELKQHFRTTDYVGNNRVVFNIKGNDFRLIAIIIYISKKVYVRWVGTHAEYDKIEAKKS